MLVTFSSREHGSVTLFGEVAVTLLELMGHSGTVPGTLPAREVPSAIARLEAAVPARPPAPQLDDEDEDEEPSVSLRHRALPLIELLKAAAKDGNPVMWDRSNGVL